MDIEIEHPREGQQTHTPTSQRLKYDAEIRVFKAQHGDLESVRQRLGLSRRKICQLLLVDPSAWTRWMRDPSRVPPHVYRSLEWYLALNQRALTQPELAQVLTRRYHAEDQEGARVTEELRQDLAHLSARFEAQRRLLWALIGVVVLAAFAALLGCASF